MLFYQQGDLLTAAVDCIVQQCNCVGITPKGLLLSIAQHLNVCPYTQRRKGSYAGDALPEDFALPGSIEVYATERQPAYVAIFYAQFQKGPSGKYQRYVKEQTFTDSAEEREMWFSLCLDHLRVALFEMPEIKKLAFPAFIGCGLAGGYWSHYEALIRRWVTQLPKDYEIYIIKK